MFKKFQDLFFEEDDDELEEEEVVEVQPRRRRERAEEPEEKPAKRVDIRVDERPAEPVPAAPVKKEPVPEPVQEVKPAPEKRATSINIDELAEGRPAQPAYQAPVRPDRKPSGKSNSNNKKPSYEFQPVISPYFGVAEKDVDSMTTSAAPSAKKGKDEYTPQIISPMYGLKTEDRPSPIQTTVEKSNRMEEMTPAPKKVEAEEQIPDFSLDDILNRRDEEELIQPSLFDDTEEVIDQTTVFRTDRGE